MPQGVAAVSRGKKLLLLGEMLRPIRHPDKELTSDFTAGILRAERLDETGVSTGRQEVEEPETTVDELVREARNHQKATWSRVKPSDEAALDAAIWAKKLEEADQNGDFAPRQAHSR